MFFDVDSDSSFGVAKDGTNDPLRAWTLSTGAIASYLEGSLWYSIFGSPRAGASAVSAIAGCLRNGGAVAVVTSQTVDSILAATPAPDEV
jgi:hypothetical protein